MITAIEIENFKAIGRRQRIEIKPITLLFGANSSGKSSILHAIHYAREILIRRNLDADRTESGAEFVDLGGFRNFLHVPTTTNRIKLRFELDLTNTNLLGLYTIPEIIVEAGDRSVDLSAFGDDFSTGAVDLTIEWSESRNGPYVAEYAIEADGHPLAAITAFADVPENTRISTLNFGHPALQALFGDESDVFASDALAHWYGWPFDRHIRRWEDGDPVAAGDLNPQGMLVHTFEDSVSFDSDSLRKCEVLDGADHPYCIILGRRKKYATVAPVAFWFADDVWKQADADRFVAQEGHVDSHQSLVDQDDALPDLSGHLSPGVVPAEEEDERDFRNRQWMIALLLGRLLIPIGRALREELRNFRYVGPLRTIPPRDYAAPTTVDPSRWASGLGAWDALHAIDSESAELVNDWLIRLRTGYGVHLKLHKELEGGTPLYLHLLTGKYFDEIDDVQAVMKALPTHKRVVFFDIDTDIDFHPSDVGAGLSQVLPVVVSLLHPGAKLLAIEQPELHVHPGVQVGIGDLLIDSIEKTSAPRIIETHSEHLLLRLLRRIREAGDDDVPEGEPGLKPHQLAVCYLEQVDGEVRVSPLRIDETGEFIDRWPKGFFEERAEELF